MNARSFERSNHALTASLATSKLAMPVRSRSPAPSGSQVKRLLTLCGSVRRQTPCPSRAPSCPSLSEHMSVPTAFSLPTDRGEMVASASQRLADLHFARAPRHRAGTSMERHCSHA
jgi:hypothetical protein